MTEDERAIAVLNDLAGIVPCPACNWALFDNWKNRTIMILDEDGHNLQPRFACPNRDCPMCCLDEHAHPMDCRKDLEQDRWFSGDNDQ